MSNKHTTIKVDAAKYEDEDNCLEAAARDYVSENPELKGYDLNPRWAMQPTDIDLPEIGDGTDRSTILLDLPGETSVSLTSYNMGDATEDDFDSWAQYVSEHIDDATGLSVAVETQRFGHHGSDSDQITAPTDRITGTIREALRKLWEDWCAEGAPTGEDEPAAPNMDPFVAEATFTDVATGRTYEAILTDLSHVEIYERRGDTKVWAGAGDWDGESIQDCDAVLGGSQEAAERIYDGLSEALCDVLAGPEQDDSDSETDPVNGQLASAVAGTKWTYEGYWNVVLGGNRSAADVIGEFDLDPTNRSGLDEWLGNAERESWSAGDGNAGAPMPQEWWTFHQRALEALVSRAPAHEVTLLPGCGGPVAAKIVAKYGVSAGVASTAEVVALLEEAGATDQEIRAFRADR